MRTIRINSIRVDITSSKDIINAYSIWNRIPDIPFKLARQLARFIRINPERPDSLERTNQFKLSYFPDENIWEAVTENIASINGKHYFYTDKIANFSPKENYQMTL